jgi:hypothetical protein
LQLRRSVLRSIPPYVLRLTVVDALVVLGLVLPVSVALVVLWTQAEAGPGVDRGPAALLPAVALLSAGALGWSMETRSQRVTGKTPKGDRLALVIRMAGALSAVLAIVLFGLADKFSVRELGTVRFDASRAALSGVLTVLLCVFAALLGRYALDLASKSRGHQLAVFLGLVTFVAGIAAQTDLSPLLAAMAAGLVLTNLPSEHLDRFSRFILRAEHAVAVFFALLAGVLLSPALHPWAFLLIAGLLVIRLVAKPTLTRVALRSERFGEDAPLPERSTLFTATARQSPIAMAMGVALVVDEWSEFHAQLLFLVLLTGLLSELVPTLLSYGKRSGSSAREREAAEASGPSDIAFGGV